ncbi:hypothetical protein JTE90_003741 [Oedothorax gibbosus]|uniref:HAT C-terminal dimerisation domain-containing protein n=1 Tax=Oedothorax gibbosus TaxID=931172 RepID=A0AAV6V9W7_9ARAC|nr:hypothetical protein JTE90_003741 [Oedothorax gibbosus]
MEGGSTSLVCSADVAAFVDALETINYNEVECYESGENVVICISEDQAAPPPEEEAEELSVTDIEDACTDTSGGTFFNPDTRKLKAVMQKLVAQKKAVIVKKSLVNTKGTKQFKSDVWNWFGDVRLFLTESDAYRLKIPFYIRSEGVMICRVFVGCFRCNALFMYDAQKHSTSTLRYHVRACNRPKECIFVSDDKMDEDPPEGTVSLEAPLLEGGQKAPTKRFRTDPRKQKEVIEQLFAKQRAVVTKKSFMNMKGNRRFKSDVWNWFGDIKLLISRSEAKKLKIPYYIRRCGDEQMVLSKVFVGCFKCLALFIHDSQKSTSTLRYHIRTCSRPKERKKRTQPNIIFIPKRGGVVGPRAPSGEAIPAHEKLLNFALSTEGSLEVLRDPEFHKVLQMCIAVGAIYGDVNIDSLLCATPTLTSFILNDLYVTSINEFYTEFQHSYGATYRPSVWIDEQVKCPFVSVQCSYATREGDLKSVIVHTDDFDYESKTADGMTEWFSRFLSDQPVIPFKRLVATDSESNLAQAFKDEIVVKCCVQNITNALQAVSSKGAAGGASSELPDFTNFLSNCVDLVEHFDLAQHRLTQDLVKCLDDKWTSIMGLFRSIEGQYEEVLNALNDAGTTHLLSVEKSALTATVDFFRSFEEAIIQLSSATEPTLNLVIPWIIRLQDRCSVDPRDSAALKQFKSCVGLEMADRVVKNVTVYHRMATFLDPRFKKVSLGTAADHLESSVKVKCLVKECMESPCMEDMLDSRSRRPEEHEAQDTGKCEKAALEEVDRYLAEPFHLPGGPHHDVLATVFPVLKWWTEQTETYPNLSRIAMWLLSCPASSALENESFWSNNWLVNCPRYPIPPDNVNKVLFVKTFRGL